jgi:hypothetical protein
MRVWLCCDKGLTAEALRRRGGLLCVLQKGAEVV